MRNINVNVGHATGRVLSPAEKTNITQTEQITQCLARGDSQGIHYILHANNVTALNLSGQTLNEYALRCLTGAVLKRR